MDVVKFVELHKDPAQATCHAAAGDDDVQFVKLKDGACTPMRASHLAAGFDLFAASGVTINPGSRALVSTGIALSLPRNTYGRIAGRSGLALNHGICIGGGVIDADYRGEVKCLLFNHDVQPFKVEPGSRIAQLIVTPISHPVFHEVNDLELTDRGSSGFGSTDGSSKQQ